MRTLFQIHPAPDAPHLIIDGAFPHAPQLLTFDGSAKTRLFPDRACPARPERSTPWGQFFSVAPGAFALSEEAREECEEMYYTLSMGTELIAAGDARYPLRIINPVSFAPPSGDPAFPFTCGVFSRPSSAFPAGIPQGPIACPARRSPETCSGIATMRMASQC